MLDGLRSAYRLGFFSVLFARHRFELSEARRWCAEHGFDSTRVMTGPRRYAFLQQTRPEQPAASFEIELMGGALVVVVIVLDEPDEPGLAWLRRRRRIGLEQGIIVEGQEDSPPDEGAVRRASGGRSGGLSS